MVLAFIFAGAVLGYCWLGEYDFVDAIWLTTITISSVGFSETSDSPAVFKLFTVGVIILGMSAAAYTFGGFVQMVLEGELQEVLGHRRMTRGIDKLQRHVVVCGYGRIGEFLAGDLRQSQQHFVVIERGLDRFEEAKALGFLCLCGDATEDSVLASAGIDRARCLVSCLPSDADNVFITLTARNLRPSLEIIARAEHPTTEAKLMQAGANKVVMPAIIGAHRIERLVTRPSTAQLMELVAESSFLDLELDEITLADDSKLIGVKVAETEAHRKHRLLVVAVRGADGQMIFNPEAAYTFRAGDIAIVMGHVEDIRGFRTAFEL
ncbi:MAG: potassium channel protein [Planctomycetaceae bacterium]|nr:potassium channel protein [Planctomycetaceae bacterium]